MWPALFWISVAFVFYAYFGYPLALFVLGKFRRHTDVPRSADYRPSVCVFISAFNEEKVLRRKIENSLSLDYPRNKLKIIVASDGSSDATVAIARDYDDLGVTLHNFSARRGKSATINSVMKHVREEVVVFTDANAIFAADALKKMVAQFCDPRIGCVVGKLRYVDRHTSGVGKGEGIYWRYESKISRMESALQKVLVANGSIFAIRRRLFRQLHPEVANDFQLPVDIASQGYGVVYEPQAEAIERTTIFWQEEFQRKLRIVLRGITGFSVLADRFKGFRLWQFASHKLLRWSVAPFLLLALATNGVLAARSWFFAGAAVLQAAFYLAAFNGWRLRKAKKPHRFFYVPFYFTMVNLAATVAIVKFAVGRRQAVWEKAESARFSPIHTPAEPFSAVASPDLEDELHRPASSAVRVSKN
ncbi:MAG: glycosyltransferase family 2 protein [Chitinivibrionia bacterium]|nr:glycosyltransferase family 2 protein [Chitinivibrionia bacterium]